MHEVRSGRRAGDQRVGAGCELGTGRGGGQRSAPVEQTSDSSDPHTRKTPRRLEALLGAGDRDPTVPSMAQAGNHPLWAPVLRGGEVGSA